MTDRMIVCPECEGRGDPGCVTCHQYGFDINTGTIPDRRAPTANDRKNRPIIHALASLAAAISLLEKSPKTAAPSNKMFDQMLADYRKALYAARDYIISEEVE